MGYKTAKNLLSSRDVYNRYYGDFRGVDFSSDHTQVHEQRFAYAVNMYKDYQSAQGQAIETIAGFRRRVVLPEESEVYGIHRFQVKDGNGNSIPKILIHAGKKLYAWSNYPRSVNVLMSETVTLPAESAVTGTAKIFKIVLDESVYSVKSLLKPDGDDVLINASFDRSTHELSVTRSDLAAGDILYLSYMEGELSVADALVADMNARKSVSFIFNNRLYLLDGKNYLVYDGSAIKSVLETAYVPTTYINIIPSGENADIGKEYEQRNILQSKFRHTFIADGTTTDFYMNENALDSIVSVKVYGEEKSANTDYTVDLAGGIVKFATAPSKPETVTQIAGTDGSSDVKYPEFYAGVEITASKAIKKLSGVVENTDEIGNLIAHCTIATVFDNRVFMSGNPSYPNHVFFCGRNSTGYVDPTYFGVLNYMQDGVGIAPITGMIPVADTLMVLKDDTQQDGSTYFHTPSDTNVDLNPRVYPSSQGLSGVGCLGACVNFLDDPIFISRLGVEAIGQLSVRYERAVEHRSSLIDAKLVNMDLTDACVEEWNGYLVLLVDGKIFLADSRQRYTHAIGTMQYEWYYIEGVGVYKNQYPEYHYAEKIHPELDGKTVHFCTKCKKGARHCTCGNDDNIIELPIMLANSVFYADSEETTDLTGTVVNPPDNDGEETVSVFDESVSVSIDAVSYNIGVYYTVHAVYDGTTGAFSHYEAYLCEGKGNCTGGVFNPAKCLKSMDANIFFGTTNGVVCSFNFDKRADSGEIAPKWYSFDERTIHCGCATKMDCCGVPHLTKNTVKKSTVIKTKSMQTSAAKIKIRTNKKPYTQIARINSTLFSFDNMDFSDFSFITTDQSLFAIKEKEKQWVEKQYYIYSDEYMKPFALYYITFRYTIAGRYKQ